MCCLGLSQQWSNIGSDNALAPMRRLAIMWANDGLAYWRICASLGLKYVAVDEKPHNGLIPASGDIMRLGGITIYKLPFWHVFSIYMQEYRLDPYIL